MLKSKSLLAVALAAAFALPVAANAAGTDRPSGSASSGGGSTPSMKQLDTDRDGTISKEEAKKSSTVSKRFKELDKDSDGKLSATEMNAAEATGAGGSGKSSSTPGDTRSGTSGGSSPKKSY